MATTISRPSASQQPAFPSPSRDDNRPAKRKKDQRTEIWSNLLRQTREAQARSRTHAVQTRELLVCGGSPEDQASFVQSLARPPPPAPPTRNRAEQKPRGEVRLSNRFAYGYGHVTLFSPPQQQGLLGPDTEEVARVELHTLPYPEEGYEATVRRLLERKRKDKEVEDESEAGVGVDDGRRPAVAILLSWKQPWHFLHLLKRWLQLLARALLPPGAADENPVEVLKEHRIALTFVVQHVEAQEGLEREGYNEDRFDYISQCLRTCILPLAAGLVYTSSNPPPQQPGAALSEIQKVIYASAGLDLTPLSPAPAKISTSARREDLAPKHNVVDRMAIVVPSGWDSVGKIRLLSETFSPESVLEAWTVDLNIPSKPAEQPRSLPEQPSSPVAAPGQQTDGDDEKDQDPTVYATSDVGSDSELDVRPLSPSKRENAQSAITAYEQSVLDPQAHKAPKGPTLDVTTKNEQDFLSDMRSHLLALEAQDAERAHAEPKSNSHASAGLGAAAARTTGGVPVGEQTGALHELGDVSFNVGGVSYNTVTAEAAIENLRLRQGPPRTQQNSSTASPARTDSPAPRTGTPRPPRREEREGSTPAMPSVDKLEPDKLEGFFASLMKKGGGGAGSAASTPSKVP